MIYTSSERGNMIVPLKCPFCNTNYIRSDLRQFCGMSIVVSSNILDDEIHFVDAAGKEHILKGIE